MRIDPNNLTIHIHTETEKALMSAVSAIAAAVARLEDGLQITLAQVEAMRMANEEVKAVLDEVAAAVTALAETQTAHGVKLAEIGADLDALIAAQTDPDLLARAQAIKAQLDTAKAGAEATQQTLDALAAKHEPVDPSRVDSDGGGNGSLPDGRK